MGEEEEGGGVRRPQPNKTTLCSTFFFCVPLDPKHYFIKQSVESSCFYISMPILEVALKNLNYNIL